MNFRKHPELSRLSTASVAFSTFLTLNPGFSQKSLIFLKTPELSRCSTAFAVSLLSQPFPWTFQLSSTFAISSLAASIFRPVQCAMEARLRIRQYHIRYLSIDSDSGFTYRWVEIVLKCTWKWELVRDGQDGLTPRFRWTIPASDWPPNLWNIKVTLHRFQPTTSLWVYLCVLLVGAYTYIYPAPNPPQRQLPTPKYTLISKALGYCL